MLSTLRVYRVNPVSGLTYQNGSSVTKLFLIDTSGYIDRKFSTNSFDNCEQKETSRNRNFLHSFNNLQEKATHLTFRDLVFRLKQSAPATTHSQLTFLSQVFSTKHHRDDRGVDN